MDPVTPSRPQENRSSVPWHRDPYALGFIALLVVVAVIGIALLVRVVVSPLPSPPVSEKSGAPAKAAPVTQQGEGQNPVAAALARLHLVTREVAGRVRATLQGTPSGGAPVRLPAKNDPERSYPALATEEIPAAPHVLPVPANGNWTYDVAFGPAWQTAGRLNYVTLPAAPGTPPTSRAPVQATMSWTPSGGQTSTWNLGVVAANHPTHANTRFPGFFMHAAYLPEQLQAGQPLKWEFPWQGGNAAQTGRVRRYEMTVTGWERVRVPAGVFDTARLEGTLRYVEGETVRAEVRYHLWYAPRAKQVVRLVWKGRAPDESGTEMMAELAAHRLP